MLACLYANRPQAGMKTDVIPLFLLAGAFALQIGPALSGMCFFPSLKTKAILGGALAGLLATALASLPGGFIIAAIGDMTKTKPPFSPWPLALHPAIWGMAANLAAITLFSLFSKERKKACRRRLGWHAPPDGGETMPANAAIWRKRAWLLTFFFLTLSALPLVFPARGRIIMQKLFPLAPALAIWQVLAWIAGLLLVALVLSRLQPVYSPPRNMALARGNQRYRIRAGKRKLKDELKDEYEHD
jgi:hypothetical protein